MSAHHGGFGFRSQGLGMATKLVEEDSAALPRAAGHLSLSTSQRARPRTGLCASSVLNPILLTGRRFCVATSCPACDPPISLRLLFKGSRQGQALDTRPSGMPAAGQLSTYGVTTADTCMLQERPGGSVESPAAERTPGRLQSSGSIHHTGPYAESSLARCRMTEPP